MSKNVNPQDNRRGIGQTLSLSPSSAASDGSGGCDGGGGNSAGGRLARRARSFKDDLLERLTHGKHSSSSLSSSPTSQSQSSPTYDLAASVMLGGSMKNKPAAACPALVAAAAAGTGIRPQHHSPQQHLNSQNTPSTPSTGRQRHARSRHSSSTGRRDGRSTPTKDTLRKTSQKILRHLQDSVSSGIGSLSRNTTTSASKEDVKGWTMSPPRSPNPAEVGNLQRKLSGALRYMRDAEEKGAWEQVPGAASVVLDTVYHLLALAGDRLPPQHSSAVMDARSEVFQACGKLLKWSDEILLAQAGCTATSSSSTAASTSTLAECSPEGSTSVDTPDYGGSLASVSTAAASSSTATTGSAATMVATDTTLLLAAGATSSAASIDGWGDEADPGTPLATSSSVVPTVESGPLVDALQEAIKVYVEIVEEKLQQRDSSVSVDSSSDFDPDDKSDSGSRRSSSNTAGNNSPSTVTRASGKKAGAVKSSASVDWGESANKLSVPSAEPVQRKSLPEITMKSDILLPLSATSGAVGGAGHHQLLQQHHHHHHPHQHHHLLQQHQFRVQQLQQRPPTPPKRAPCAGVSSFVSSSSSSLTSAPSDQKMPTSLSSLEKAKLVHSHSSDSILDAGGRPVGGSLPYMTPPPPPPKPPPSSSRDVLDSSVDSSPAPPLPPKRRQMLTSPGSFPTFSNQHHHHHHLANNRDCGPPPPLPPPRRADSAGGTADTSGVLWRHERHSSSGEWKSIVMGPGSSASSLTPSNAAVGNVFGGGMQQQTHHSHTPPPYLTSFESNQGSGASGSTAASLGKARSCSWRRVSSGGNVSQSSSQSPLDDSMSACSGDSAFSTPLYSGNRSFGEFDEHSMPHYHHRHARSPTGASHASMDPLENLHAIAHELQQLSATTTPTGGKEKRNLLAPPGSTSAASMASGSSCATLITMSASSSSSSFSSETRQIFTSSASSLTRVQQQQQQTTMASSSSLHPVPTSAPPASPPPALPAKARQLAYGAASGSHYDNVSIPRSRIMSPATESSGGSFDDDWRPPLPPKKKHVEAYMRLFGKFQAATAATVGIGMACAGASMTTTSSSAASASSVQFHYKGSLHQSHQQMVFGPGIPSLASFDNDDDLSLPPPLPPPALPPKRAPPPPPAALLPPPPLPQPQPATPFSVTPSPSPSPHGHQRHLERSLPSSLSTLSVSSHRRRHHHHHHPPPLAASSPPSSSGSSGSPSLSPSLSLSPPGSPVRSSSSPTGLFPAAVAAAVSATSSSSPTASKGDDPSPSAIVDAEEASIAVAPVVEAEDAGGDNKSDDIEWEFLDLMEVSEFLDKKPRTEDGPDEIRGGNVDVLIVHATVDLKNEYLYQEAFLTTFRTFVEPLLLIDKLTRRYDRFFRSGDPARQRAARATFSLLVRVVDDLAITDLTDDLVRKLMGFTQQLVSRGDLVHAKTLRSKLLERHNARKNFLNPQSTLPSLGVSLRQYALTDFKSEHLAEQMTLLDAELFQRIEIPEILLWVQEQNEDKSPNLTRFTEHFNKMSYWARTVILQSEPREREKLVNKFMKMMRHLRKNNNYNSYLALLSALDSAPIRRLEWQKNITEGLKEFCALIDSSASFRAYRQALQETQPPCIPYIGLVLQDLTFVHIGNPDAFSDGKINFSKRWQQFRCLDDMKRFKKCNYPFKKNEKILAFFNNFDDYLSEEALWQISESIKPRGGKKTSGG